ncbi:hypothetical protein BH11MYX3_BH11MYX3_23430 [soil metagenome]
MRVLLTSLLLLGACAGPGQNKLAGTPTAKSKANTGLAPPASTDDRDRSQQVNAMDDMHAGQAAHAEAAATPSKTPGPTPAGPSGSVQPKTQPASPETKK